MLPNRLVAVDNVARVESLAHNAAILSYGMEVAREYGRLKQYLQSKGRPLPDNDIWIAAAAVSNGLTLVTRDRHFDEVPQVTTVSWLIPR